MGFSTNNVPMKFSSPTERKSRAHQIYAPKVEKDFRTEVPFSMGSGCICGVCNEYRDDMTNSHAISHGFKDKNDMFRKGKVKYLSKCKQQHLERKLLTN